MHVDVRWLPAHPPMTTLEKTSNKGPFFLAIVATLVSIALLIFLLRVYTRTRLLRFFGIDDCLMLISVLCAIGALATFTSLTQLGLREQRDDIPAENVVTMERNLWAFRLLMVGGISFVKLSIALFLLRIIHRRSHRRLLYLAIVSLIPLTFIWVSTILFQCVPVAAAWNHERRSEARCMSRLTHRNFELFNSSVNIATDFVFALLPVAIVWKPRMDLRTRIYLVSILSLGLVSCTAAILRMPSIYHMWKEDDPLLHGAWLCVWSVIEMSTGITAACLPTLKPLLTTISTFFSDLTSSLGHHGTSKPEQIIESRPPSIYAMSHGTPTFLSLPRPKPTRFHDHTSDLDFDLYESPMHRSRMHSRNHSNLTVYSNYTTLTTTHGEGQAMRPMACSKGLTDLGADMRGFKSGYAVSVTSGSGEICEGSEEGKTIERVGSEEDVGNGENGMSVVAVVGGIMRTTEVKVC